MPYFEASATILVNLDRVTDIEREGDEHKGVAKIKYYFGPGVYSEVEYESDGFDEGWEIRDKVWAELVKLVTIRGNSTLSE